MQVILGGEEVQCHDFAALAAGTAFRYVTTGRVGIKTSAGTVFNLCANNTENYDGSPVVPYPDAVLVLDPSPEATP